MTIRIGVNGFGRTGRMVFRAALAHPEVTVTAMNDLTEPQTIAHLLKYDAVHCSPDQQISAIGDAIMVGKTL